MEEEKQNLVDELVEVESDIIEPNDWTQDMMLSRLIDNPVLWSKCAPILKAEYFDREYQPCVRFIIDYVNKHQKLPPRDVIRAKTDIALSKPEGEISEDFLASEVEKFCICTAYEKFLWNAADRMEENSDHNTIASLIEESKSITQISLRRDLGHEVHEGSEMLKEALKNDEIATRFRDLDEALDGGVTRPSLSIISANSGKGKSVALQNIAINYMEAGNNVIFYTMELSAPLIQKRFSAMMTGTAMSQVKHNLDEIEQEMERRKLGEGQLEVKKMPGNGTTLTDLKAHYNDLVLETGLKWSVICVDYIDVMDSVRQVDDANIHIRDKYIAQELNDWMHQENLIGWSASQQIKGADDEKDARQSAVSGGTYKVNVCDNLIILKQSQQDREDELIWGHIAKARSSKGVNAKIPFKWNSDTLRMGDGDRQLFAEANPWLVTGKKSAGQKQKTILETDAIAREFDGVKTISKKLPTTEPKKQRRAKEIRDKIAASYARRA